MDQHSPIAPSREDAFLVEVSTLARQSARRLLILGEDEVEDIAQDIVLECLIGFRSPQRCLQCRAEEIRHCGKKIRMIGLRVSQG